MPSVPIKRLLFQLCALRSGRSKFARFGAFGDRNTVTLQLGDLALASFLGLFARSEGSSAQCWSKSLRVSLKIEAHLFKAALLAVVVGRATDIARSACKESNFVAVSAPRSKRSYQVPLTLVPMSRAFRPLATDVAEMSATRSASHPGDQGCEDGVSTEVVQPRFRLAALTCCSLRSSYRPHHSLGTGG